MPGGSPCFLCSGDFCRVEVLAVLHTITLERTACSMAAICTSSYLMPEAFSIAWISACILKRVGS